MSAQEQKVRVIVIDDEKLNIDETSSLIYKTGFMNIVGVYTDPLYALCEAEHCSPQVAFVDIEMPELDGISLAERLLEKLPGLKIVFITGWEKYAIRAFELNALDYLMKPIRPERFNKMAERIRHEISIGNIRPANKLKIRMFGQYETTIDSVPVKWGRLKAAELFAFLLTNHGEYIRKDSILENLWPEAEPASALKILQTSVCKIRNEFSRLGNVLKIDYNANSYCLIVRDAECDLFLVEKAIYEFNPNDRQTFGPVESACLTFFGGFLSEQGYLWSMPKSERMRTSLIHILNQMTGAYALLRDEDGRIRTLKLHSMLAPDDEEVNYNYLKSLETAGRGSEIMQHCAWLKRVLKEEYEITPSRQFTELMRQYREKYRSKKN